jgi:4-amino-4-deoxy-L-arabinose transferase-like glycosyltransferase
MTDIFFYGRLVILLLSVSGGLYMFRWTARNYGEHAAVLAAGFYFLSPNIIAHSTIVTTDMTAAVFIMCAVLSFRDLMSAPDTGKAFLAGAFYALALLSKFSALLLLPLFILMIAVNMVHRRRRSGERKGGAAAVAAFFASVLFMLWAGYGFELEPLLHNALRAEAKKEMFESMLAGLSIPGDLIRPLASGLYTVPVPLRSFVLGVIGVLRHGAEGARTFFMGSWSQEGHPLYYLTAFLVKTPPATILSFVAGLAVLSRERRYRGPGMYLLAVILVFFLAASKADLQLGLRYVLPVYPLIFIIGGIGLGHVMDTSRAGRTAAAVIAGWLVYSSIMIWPHHLSYFNVISGGPEKGYRYLRGSNIDWGQDLPALKDYMEKQALDEVRLSYWGEGDPALYGITFTVPEEGEYADPLNRVYAVSVNSLDTFRWTAGKEPDARAGYSIYIYDLRENG